MFKHLKEARKVLGHRHLRDVHLKTVDAVDRLNSCEADLIRCIQEVDAKLVYRHLVYRHLVYRHLGYGSVFRYCVEALRLSEHQSYAYVAVARKSVELPKLQEALEAGLLTISKAVRLTAIINEDNQNHWIELASRSTKKALEKAIATENPRAGVRESAKFLDAKTLAIQLAMSEENFGKVKRAQELLCQSTGRAVSLEETIASIAEFFLVRKDPVQKAERAKMRNEQEAKRGGKQEARKREQEATNCQEQGDEVAKAVSEKRTRTHAESSQTKNTEKVSLQTLDLSIGAPELQEARHRTDTETPLDIESLGPGRVARTNKRRAIKAAVRHAINLRDQGRCQHRMPNGALCNEQRWVELHHRVEVCNGGSDELNNLTTLHITP